jgi:hypothetical protein
MDILSSLLGDQSAGVTNQLGRQFGLDPSQASAALTALLPALAAGLKTNAASSSGLEGLAGALASGGHQRYVDDLSTLGQPETAADGNGILGHIFGSKDVSREVARRASAQSGVSADVLKQMLPVVATLVMGALARRQVEAGPAAAPGGGLLDMLSPMLDANRDGSMADDVMGMIGRFMGGR